ncbi:hypothetical protein GCM10017752_16350 [Streptomyces roseoviridis]
MGLGSRHGPDAYGRSRACPHLSGTARAGRARASERDAGVSAPARSGTASPAGGAHPARPSAGRARGHRVHRAAAARLGGRTAVTFEVFPRPGTALALGVATPVVITGARSRGGGAPFPVRPGSGRQRGSGPVATGRDGSEDHSDQEPA